MKSRKIMALMLGLIMVFSLATSVSAVEIGTSDGSGSVPVELTAEPLRFSVTVPTSLPVTVNADGVVSVADTAKIVNNGAGPVKVEGVKVEAISPWSLAEYADLSNEKVGTKKFGLSIQGTGVSSVDGSCSATFDIIPAKGEIGLEYGAYVAPQNTEVSGVGIANVVFTVGWDIPIVYRNFRVTEDNRAKVGYTGAEVKNFVIPATFQDTDGTWFKVTGIEGTAFAGDTGIISLTIPDSVTYIGGKVFDNCSLTSIVYKGTTYSSVDEFKTAFGDIEGNTIGDQG